MYLLNYFKREHFGKLTTQSFHPKGTWCCILEFSQTANHTLNPFVKYRFKKALIIEVDAELRKLLI